MLALGFAFWEDWELNDKVTFNMFTRIITVNPNVTDLDIKADIYSASKRWLLVDDNNKIGQIVRVIGGDDTIGVFKAGDIYFLVNGWRLQVDLGQTAMTGTLFSDDFDTPLIDFSGGQMFSNFVSNLVSTVKTTVNVVTGDISTVPTATQTATAVWGNSSATTLLSDVDFLKSIEGGRWDLVGDQMIFYTDDNVTEVARFDMFDSAGNPTTTGDIFKRTRV